MPGTIQVTVLEFKSVSSSSQPTAKSLKVSMGKRQFQTWDKGDFNFPLTKLREDLVVALLDAGGNEIAHADIRTMQIIEKGSWDEVFSLEGRGGGGNVHLKLRFVLSEEDRIRIRIMRESAMKKKRETNPGIILRITDSTSSTTDSVETSRFDNQDSDVVRPKSEASQDGSSLNSATSNVEALDSNYKKEQKNILGTAIPNATDTSQTGSSSPVKDEVETESPQVHERVPAEDIKATPFANMRSGTEKRDSFKLSGSTVSNKNNSVSSTSQDDSIHRYQNQGPLDKTPSSVRKMISAFEKPQEMKSLRKTASVPYQLNRLRNERLLEVRGSKVVIQPSEQSLTKHEDRFFTENLQETTTSVGQRADVSPRNTEPSQAPEESESSVAPNLHQTTTSVGKRADLSPRNTELSQAPEESESSVAPNLHQTTTSVGKRADLSPGNTELSQAPKNLESSATPILSKGKTLQIKESSGREKVMKELERSPVGLTTKSTMETEIEVRKMPEEQIQVVQANDFSAKKLDTSDTSVTERGSTSSDSINSQTASYDKPKSLEYFREEYHASQNSGMWIFPDNTSRLCITTAGKRVMRIPGSHGTEANTSKEKKVSFEPEMFQKGTKCKMAKDQKTSTNLPESGSGSSPDDSFNGLVAQVIKVVVILGFGVLVLLTRQKEPRKKSRKASVNLFTQPDYIEE